MPTCHWCHVMERESFENDVIAGILNENFIPIKVDKEERPDIDSVYMRVCQTFTGGGGWPTSIFMAPEQKPFYAGTYFPPQTFIKLIQNISQAWKNSRTRLMSASDEIINHISHKSNNHIEDKDLKAEAFHTFQHLFDPVYGGFGNAPKFPSPHNLFFLMGYSKAINEPHSLEMSEKTLLSMYKGGIFDHIGYGFSRYSTDEKWLAPHFEKMLYDNAMLAAAYLHAFEHTENVLYRSVAEKIFVYIEREMTSQSGGFYSAQDADSDDVEGKYYVFSPDETINILGKEIGERFNNLYDITSQGNFEEKNIPNLIKQSSPLKTMDEYLPQLYAYRKERTVLHRDEKILTSWNSLMLWAYATAFRILGDDKYLRIAEKSQRFIEDNLVIDDIVYVSITEGKRSVPGFIDDYAFYILALLELYHATFEEKYLSRALMLANKAVNNFFDSENGGFYFYGKDGEKLLIRPKESYDGAIPSGNSVMYYNLDRLYKLTKDMNLYDLCESQKDFMEKAASKYSHGFSFYLFATLPTKDVICVLKDKSDINKLLKKSNYVVRVFEKPTNEYPLVNDKTTFYVCEGNRCMPPVNELI